MSTSEPPNQERAPGVIWSLRSLAMIDPLATTLRISALMLLLYGGSNPGMSVPLRVICGLLLIAPDLIQSRPLWWTLLAALVIGNVQNWYLIDNHKYLMTYWTLAVAISLHTTNPRNVLAQNAKVLIALVFGYAVLWKVAGGQYSDGSFLYWTILTDWRLRDLAVALTGLSGETLDQRTTALRDLGSLGGANASLAIPYVSSLGRLTVTLSWAVLIGEAIVSVLHSLPAPSLRRLRHLSVILFIVSTYFLLPVVGFAFALAVLGFSQTTEDEWRWRLIYLALLGVIQLIVLPWKSLLT